MEVKFVDTENYFGTGYYEAVITKITKVKTKHGQRLLVWMKIKNEHQREMLVNDYLPTYTTKMNLLTRVYKLSGTPSVPGKTDTDDLINKTIGIVLIKKISKGRSYLNVDNYLKVKLPDVNTKLSQAANTEEIATQLAALLASNPDIAKLMNSKIKTLSRAHKKQPEKGGIKKLSDEIKEIDI
jgi:hypothetical protein